MPFSGPNSFCPILSGHGGKVPPQLQGQNASMNRDRNVVHFFWPAAAAICLLSVNLSVRAIPTARTLHVLAGIIPTRSSFMTPTFMITLFQKSISSFASFSKASCILSRTHSVASAWTLKMLSNSSQPPPFSAKKACFIILGVQAVSLQHFYLIHVFFGRRFAVPMALYPFLHFFLGILSKLLCFQSLTGKIRPHTSYVLVFHPAFSITFHDASSSPRPRATATSSKVYLLLPPEFCCSIAGTSWSCKIPHPHYRCKLSETEGFFTAPLVTPNTGFRGTLIALGTKRLAAERASEHLPREEPTSQMPLHQIQNQG